MIAAMIAAARWPDLWYNETALKFLELPERLKCWAPSVARIGRANGKMRRANDKGGSR